MFKKIDSKLRAEYGENSTFKFGKFYIIMTVLEIPFFMFLKPDVYYFKALLVGIMLYGIIQTQKYGLYLLYGLLIYSVIQSLFGIISPLDPDIVEGLLKNIEPYPDGESLQALNQAWSNGVRAGCIFSILFSLYAFKYFKNKKAIFTS